MIGPVFTLSQSQGTASPLARATVRVSASIPMALPAMVRAPLRASNASSGMRHCSAV